MDNQAAMKKYKIASSFALGGFKDYLASRILLEKGMLIQAATLASTAVEKFLKYNSTVRGIKLTGHINNWNNKKLSDFSETYKLNICFLKLLQVIYQVRYIDNLKKDVSFSIERLKFLAELDYTISQLSESAELHENGVRFSPFHTAIKTQDQNLSKDNWVLSGVDRDEFVTCPDKAEAYYINKILEAFSCVLFCYVPKNLSSFSKPGITKKENELTCVLVGA